MSRGRRLLIASIGMVFLLVGGTALFLHGQKAYEPPAPPSGSDIQRSQVYVTGTGYTIDRQQNKTHKQEEEKKKELQQDREQQTTPPRTPSKTASAKKITNRRSARNSRSPKKKEKTESGEPQAESNQTAPNSKPGSPSQTDNPQKPTDSGDDGLTEEEKAKRPTIRVSIASGQRVTGQRVDFTVRATDYKGRNIPVFSEDDGSYTVVFNGQAQVSTGTSGNETAFRVVLANGANEIRVEAVDREGNKNSKTVRFTGDTSAEAEQIGQVFVSIEAQILHLGVIHQTTVNIHPGDTAKDVLEEAFAEAGISPSFSGGYLAGISRAGLAEGAWIDDETREVLEEMRKTEKDPETQDKNRLKEHDFYDSSGWIYNVNGEFPERGLGSYKMEDGDALYLIFQLATDVY